ncbi:hypothetical protein JCM10207_004758 [Rhodosporidiobolus poonsookiae]
MAALPPSPTPPLLSDRSLDFSLSSLALLSPTELSLAQLHSQYTDSLALPVFRHWYRHRERARNLAARDGPGALTDEDHFALLALDFSLDRDALDRLSDAQLLCVQFHPEAGEVEVLRAENALRKRRERALADRERSETAAPRAREDEETRDVKPERAQHVNGGAGRIPMPAQGEVSPAPPSSGPARPAPPHDRAAATNDTPRATPSAPSPRPNKRPRTPSPPVQLPPFPDNLTALPPSLSKHLHVLVLSDLPAKEITSRSHLYKLFSDRCRPDAALLMRPDSRDAVARSAYVGFLDFEKRTEAMQEVLQLKIGRWLVKAGLEDKEAAWEWGDVGCKAAKELLWRKECGLEMRETQRARTSSPEQPRAEEQAVEAPDPPAAEEAAAAADDAIEDDDGTLDGELIAPSDSHSPEMVAAMLLPPQPDEPANRSPSPGTPPPPRAFPPSGLLSFRLLPSTAQPASRAQSSTPPLPPSATLSAGSLAERLSVQPSTGGREHDTDVVLLDEDATNLPQPAFDLPTSPATTLASRLGPRPAPGNTRSQLDPAPSGSGEAGTPPRAAPSELSAAPPPRQAQRPAPQRSVSGPSLGLHVRGAAGSNASPPPAQALHQSAAHQAQQRKNAALLERFGHVSPPLPQYSPAPSSRAASPATTARARSPSQPVFGSRSRSQSRLDSPASTTSSNHPLSQDAQQRGRGAARGRGRGRGRGGKGAVAAGPQPAFAPTAETSGSPASPAHGAETPPTGPSAKGKKKKGPLPAFVAQPQPNEQPAANGFPDGAHLGASPTGPARGRGRGRGAASVGERGRGRGRGRGGSAGSGGEGGAGPSPAAAAATALSLADRLGGRQATAPGAGAKKKATPAGGAAGAAGGNLLSRLQ